MLVIYYAQEHDIDPCLNRLRAAGDRHCWWSSNDRPRCKQWVTSYSELCLIQLVKHVPIIHAFAPGMHTCVVTPHGERFSMWRISTLTKVITEQCFYLEMISCSSGVAIYTGFHISVFLGAVRIWRCVFQL